MTHRAERRGLLLFSLIFGPVLWIAVPSAAQQSSPSPRADLSPARELVKVERFDEADLMLADLQTKFPDDPAFLLLRGEVLLARKNPAEAVGVLRHAAEVAPQKTRVQFNLGTALSQTGDETGALEAFQKEIELNQDVKIRAMARVNRSVLFEKGQRWSESAAEMEALLELDPERKEAYGDLTGTYLRAGRPDDAQRALERGAEKGFQSPSLRFSVGAAYFNEKKFDRAAEAFQQVLEIQPDFAQAELSLARALDQLGRREEANPHYRRYLELDPTGKESAAVKKRLAPPAAKGKKGH